MSTEPGLILLPHDHRERFHLRKRTLDLGDGGHQSIEEALLLSGAARRGRDLHLIQSGGARRRGGRRGFS
jgi:hypothetical protein